MNEIKPKKKKLLDNTPKIPRFDAAQWFFIDQKIMDGYEPKELLELFRDQFYNGNGYCRTTNDKQTFIQRILRRRQHLRKSRIYERASKYAKGGLAKKDARLRTRKVQVSRTMLELEKLKDSFDEKDKYLEYYIKLKTLLLKELRDLAIEMGEFQTSNISVNIDQRKVIFRGRAVLPELDKDQLKELEVRRVVELPPADSVETVEGVEVSEMSEVEKAESPKMQEGKKEEAEP